MNEQPRKRHQGKPVKGEWLLVPFYVVCRSLSNFEDEPVLALCPGKPWPSGALGAPTQVKHSILRHTELTLVLRASDALGSTHLPWL